MLQHQYLAITAFNVNVCKLFCKTENIQFRLSDRWYGKVEVKYHSEWGRVCNSHWDDTDASVVCKQLGYVDGQLLRNAPVQTPGQGYVRMNDVQCKGDERSILECKHMQFWKPSTVQCTDATVACNVTSKYLFNIIFILSGNQTGHYVSEVVYCRNL